MSEKNLKLCQINYTESKALTSETRSQNGNIKFFLKSVLTLRTLFEQCHLNMQHMLKIMPREIQ